MTDSETPLISFDALMQAKLALIVRVIGGKRPLARKCKISYSTVKKWYYDRVYGKDSIARIEKLYLMCFERDRLGRARRRKYQAKQAKEDAEQKAMDKRIEEEADYHERRRQRELLEGKILTGNFVDAGSESRLS